MKAIAILLVLLLVVVIAGCTATQSQSTTSPEANLSAGNIDSMIQELNNMGFEDLGGLSE